MDRIRITAALLLLLCSSAFVHSILVVVLYHVPTHQLVGFDSFRVVYVLCCSYCSIANCSSSPQQQQQQRWNANRFHPQPQHVVQAAAVVGVRHRTMYCTPCWFELPCLCFYYSYYCSSTVVHRSCIVFAVSRVKRRTIPQKR